MVMDKGHKDKRQLSSCHFLECWADYDTFLAMSLF